jgi:hypothetical protein
MFTVLFVAALALSASAARAGEARSDGSSGDGYRFGLSGTIGEGMYFVNDDVYRGPVSLEVVPSLGGVWAKFDLGLSTTLESIKIEGTDVGNWNFTFRPGARLTPPMTPLYLRLAVPLVLRPDSFDFGLMFGLGLDIPILPNLGLIFETDTTLSKTLEWGGKGVPLEFRIGVIGRF